MLYFIFILVTLVRLASSVDAGYDGFYSMATDLMPSKISTLVNTFMSENLEITDKVTKTFGILPGMTSFLIIVVVLPILIGVFIMFPMCCLGCSRSYKSCRDRCKCSCCCRFPSKKTKICLLINEAGALVLMLIGIIFMIVGAYSPVFLLSQTDDAVVSLSGKVDTGINSVVNGVEENIVPVVFNLDVNSIKITDSLKNTLKAYGEAAYSGNRIDDITKYFQGISVKGDKPIETLDDILELFVAHTVNYVSEKSNNQTVLPKENIPLDSLLTDSAHEYYLNCMAATTDCCRLLSEISEESQPDIGDENECKSKLLDQQGSIGKELFEYHYGASKEGNAALLQTLKRYSKDVNDEYLKKIDCSTSLQTSHVIEELYCDMKKQVDENSQYITAIDNLLIGIRKDDGNNTIFEGNGNFISALANHFDLYIKNFVKDITLQSNRIFGQLIENLRTYFTAANLPDEAIGADLKKNCMNLIDAVKQDLSWIPLDIDSIFDSIGISKLCSEEVIEFGPNFSIETGKIFSLLDFCLAGYDGQRCVDTIVDILQKSIKLDKSLIDTIGLIYFIYGNIVETLNEEQTAYNLFLQAVGAKKVTDSYKKLSLALGEIIGDNDYFTCFGKESGLNGTKCDTYYLLEYRKFTTEQSSSTIQGQVVNFFMEDPAKASKILGTVITIIIAFIPLVILFTITCNLTCVFCNKKKVANNKKCARSSIKCGRCCPCFILSPFCALMPLFVVVLSATLSIIGVLMSKGIRTNAKGVFSYGDDQKKYFSDLSQTFIQLLTGIDNNEFTSNNCLVLDRISFIESLNFYEETETEINNGDVPTQVKMMVTSDLDKYKSYINQHSEESIVLISAYVNTSIVTTKRIGNYYNDLCLISVKDFYKYFEENLIEFTGKLPDSDELITFETKVNLENIYSESPSLFKLFNISLADKETLKSLVERINLEKLFSEFQKMLGLSDIFDSFNSQINSIMQDIESSIDSIRISLKDQDPRGIFYEYGNKWASRNQLIEEIIIKTNGSINDIEPSIDMNAKNLIILLNIFLSESNYKNKLSNTANYKTSEAKDEEEWDFTSDYSLDKFKSWVKSSGFKCENQETYSINIEKYGERQVFKIACGSTFYRLPVNFYTDILKKLTETTNESDVKAEVITRANNLLSYGFGFYDLLDTIRLVLLGYSYPIKFVVNEMTGLLNKELIMGKAEQQENGELTIFSVLYDKVFTNAFSFTDALTSENSIASIKFLRSIGSTVFIDYLCNGIMKNWNILAIGYYIYFISLIWLIGAMHSIYPYLKAKIDIALKTSGSDEIYMQQNELRKNINNNIIDKKLSDNKKSSNNNSGNCNEEVVAVAISTPIVTASNNVPLVGNVSIDQKTDNDVVSKKIEESNTFFGSEAIVAPLEDGFSMNSEYIEPKVIASPMYQFAPPNQFNIPLQMAAYRNAVLSGRIAAPQVVTQYTDAPIIPPVMTNSPIYDI